MQQKQRAGKHGFGKEGSIPGRGRKWGMCCGSAPKGNEAQRGDIWARGKAEDVGYRGGVDIVLGVNGDEPICAIMM